MGEIKFRQDGDPVVLSSEQWDKIIGFSKSALELSSKIYDIPQYHSLACDCFDKYYGIISVIKHRLENDKRYYTIEM